MSGAALAGRTALVTGAAGGIGAAIATRLAGDGARLVLLDLDRVGLERVAREDLSPIGAEVQWHVTDICDLATVRAAVEQSVAELGTIDVLVNNAGRWTVGPFVDSRPEQWKTDVDVNLVGTLNVTHAVVPGMIEAAYGRIVNIVSDSGRVGEPNVAVYSAAKAAVMGFSRSVAKELGRHGITVNCVSLSTTLTPAALETFDERQLQKMPRHYPAGRLGWPDDPAAAVAYFTSSEASWVTGQTLSVNGGYAML